MGTESLPIPNERFNIKSNRDHLIITLGHRGG